jgi:hypothetical protein
MPICIGGLRTDTTKSPEVLRPRSFLVVAVMASGFDALAGAAVGGSGLVRRLAKRVTVRTGTAARSRVSSYDTSGAGQSAKPSGGALSQSWLARGAGSGYDFRWYFFGAHS